MYKFIDTEYTVLSKALTRAEVIRGMDDAGYIEGVVSITLASLIDSDFENFLDLVAERLIGSVCLSDIDYKIVGCASSDEVLLLVSGHADEVADALEDIPDAVDAELPEKFSFTSRQNPLANGIVYKAERANEHGDYHVCWGWDADENSSIEEFKVNDDYYTEKEVRYFVSSDQWLIQESA